MTAVVRTARTMLTMEDLPAAPWIGYMDDLARLMATGDIGAHRVIVALPTVDMAAAIIAVAAVKHLGRLRSAAPLPVVGPDDEGHSVSAFMSGEYRDALLSAATSGRVRVDGTTFSLYADVVRRLPKGLTANRPRMRRLDGRTVAAWTTIAGDTDPARVHAHVAATPVVVIGDHRPFAADLTELDALWSSASELADSHSDLDRWFRHPVLVCDPGAVPPAWLADVTPSVVVLVGAAAWRSPVRQALWNAPHLLLLDRRSAAAVDIVDDISLTNPVTRPLRSLPPQGIEAWGIEEIAGTWGAESEGEELF